MWVLNRGGGDFFHFLFRLIVHSIGVNLLLWVFCLKANLECYRVIPFHYPHPVTGRKVNDDDLRSPHYGQDVSTSDKPLSLKLPDGQTRPGAEEGVTECKPGTKILPELVQNKPVNGA
jgi:hypothetical protein